MKLEVHSIENCRANVRVPISVQSCIILPIKVPLIHVKYILNEKIELSAQICVSHRKFLQNP